MKKITSEDVVRLKYAILRRAIHKEYPLETLKWICGKMECKDYKGLKRLHKKWIGY